MMITETSTHGHVSPFSVKSDDDYTTYVAVAGGCLGALCLAAVLLFLFMKRRRYQNNHAKPKERQLSGHENPNFENGPEIDIYGDRGSSEKPYRRDTIPATDACGNIAPKERLQGKPSWIQMIDDYKFDSLPAWSKTIDTRGSWKK